MKDSNKHPHHDLMVELISDTSKQVEMATGSNSVVDVEAYNVLSDKQGLYTFRIKPRKFIRGHWYPCLHRSGTVTIMMFNGEQFVPSAVKKYGVNESSLKDIGKSLGEIKFK